MLTIEGIRSAGRAAWVPGDAPCVAPGLDEAGTIIIDLGQTVAGGAALRNWTLRPFDGCGNLPQCGLVLVTLSDAESGEILHQSASAQVSVPIEFARLGLPETRYDVRVELIDDQGRRFRLEGGVVASELSGLLISTTCAPASAEDAGVDAVSPTPTDSGSDAALPEGGVEGGSPADASLRDASTGEAGNDVDASVEAGVDASGPDGSEGGVPADASLDAADASKDAPDGA